MRYRTLESAWSGFYDYCRRDEMLCAAISKVRHNILHGSLRIAPELHSWDDVITTVERTDMVVVVGRSKTKFGW